MADKNPLAYTGRVSGSTTVQGDVQFNADQFSVTNGVVQLAGQGLAMDTATSDSGSATPTAAGVITFAGGSGLSTSATGNTLTINQDASTSAMQYADVTITATEVKALATTPKELVAAQGAGNAILFMGAQFKLNYGSEVFAEAGDNLGIKYTDALGVQVSDTIETTGFIDQSADTMTNAVPVKDAIVAAASAENQALVLDNLGSNITGNASDDSTLTVRIFYQVVAL